MTSGVLLLLTLLLSCAIEIPEGPPVLVLPAETIDFDEVVVNAQSMTAALSLKNVGVDSLTLSEVALSDDSSSDFELEFPEDASIPGGEELGLWLTFLPTTLGLHEGLLTMTTNDPEQPSVALPVMGYGVSPVLVADPEVLWMPEVSVGDSQQLMVSLLSTGTGGVKIYDVFWEDPSAEAAFEIIQTDAMAAMSETDPLYIPEGYSHSVDVRFTPPEEGWWDELLLIRSNAPNSPTTSVRVLAGTCDVSSEPTVTILTPDAGSVLTAGEEASLSAAVQSSCFSEESLATVWFATAPESPRVYLGANTGGAPVTTQLPAGDPLIVYVETHDPLGGFGTDSVEITVEAQ